MKRYGLILVFSTFSMIGCAGGVGYYANVPPPPIRAEAYGPAPGPGYVWTSGYWGWRGNSYAWVGGNWSRPPRARAVWVAPYWERAGARYRFHAGRWR
jgi:WXXGXW repeat (2 copies)